MVLPWVSRSTRRQPRAVRRKALTALESLEGRQLLSNTPLGYSLPDLQVKGSAAPVASWGGTFTTTIVVQNTGASTMRNPLALAPGSQGTADAPNTTVSVFLLPRRHSLAGAYKLGTITAPALEQNDLEQITSSFTLPDRPRGFARAGGRFYVAFSVDPDNAVLESNGHNNLSPAVPVKVVGKYLPLLQATALDVPATMQPGDTIQPSFSIANFGTASTRLQGPVQVALVASVDPEFTLGSSIVAIYQIGNVASLSNTPIKSYFRSGRVNVRRATVDNLTSNNNVANVTGTAVTLPTSPRTYYLGLVIDPYNQLQQLPHTGKRFQLIRRVGPATSGLPPAGVVTPGGGANAEEFPNTPNGESVGFN
jgi:hypothetical protein